MPIFPTVKVQFLHPQESTVALAQPSGKGHRFIPRYGGRDTYVEVLDKMRSRSERGNAVPVPLSTATASSSASVLVGKTIPPLTLTLALLLLSRTATASHLLHPPGSRPITIPILIGGSGGSGTGRGDSDGGNVGDT